MTYPNIRPGTFIKRPNRFIAHVEVEGVEEVCHVKNTGRCRELLIPGATVWLVESDNPARKTRFDLAWKIPWTRSLAGYSPWGPKESDTAEQLHC